MSRPHNSHFGVTGSKPHFAINHIVACCAVTLHCMPDTVVFLRDIDITLVPFFCCYCLGFYFIWWLDYRCNFSQTCPPHLRRSEPLLSLSPPRPPHLCCFSFRIIWLNSKTFLSACQSLDHSRLSTYVIWVAVKHEPAINYTTIWAMHLERIDCLGFISWAPHSLDSWRLLAKDRVRRECSSMH